jgi:hypothetical protein
MMIGSIDDAMVLMESRFCMDGRHFSTDVNWLMAHPEVIGRALDHTFLCVADLPPAKTRNLETGKAERQTME